MKWIPVIAVLSIVSLLVTGCSASRLVNPIGSGKINVSVDAGGPIFKYGENYIPMPLSSVSAAYGLHPDLSLFAGGHATALFYGTGQIDIGAVKELLSPMQARPGISITPALNMMLDAWEYHPRIYPSLDLNLYWHVYERKDYFYFGMSNWFEILFKRAHGESQPTHWVPAVHGGYTFIPGKMRFTLEAKYLAPWHSNQDITVEYYGPLKTGTLGAYLSVGYTF